MNTFITIIVSLFASSLTAISLEACANKEPSDYECPQLENLEQHHGEGCEQG
jgi:hypothetical protein